MTIKRLTAFFLSTIFIFSCGCTSTQNAANKTDISDDAVVSGQNTQSTEEAVSPEAAVASDIELGVIADDTHPALLQCDEEDCFYPDREVSRGELCTALAEILTGLPSDFSVSYEDLSSDDEDYAAISSLYFCGLLPWSAEYPLHSDLSVTYDEISIILNRIAACVNREEASRFISLAEAYSGSNLLDRTQLAYILVTAIGRQPSEAGLLYGEYLPADVQPDSLYWSYIADAVTDIEPDVPVDGVFRAYGSLYGVWQNGILIKDLDYGIWSFDSSGRYTTGDSELDSYLYNALEECGAVDLPTEEALQAAYLYVKYNFEYIVTPADMETVDTGVTGWEYERALRFFQYGGGTCYGYAAVFGLMARMLGENAYIVSARVNQYDWPHGFVVIPEDGVDWIYDPELEATRQDRHADLELFHIENYTIYNYWYETDW